MGRNKARAGVSHPRGKRLPPDERREHLLEVAAGILLSEGARRLTMERLAERAGVSKGLGYAYFSDTEDVTLELWDREVAVVYQRVEAALAGEHSLEERLRRAVGAYFDVITERGALLGALQARLAISPAPRRSGQRVRDFVLFWTQQLGAALDVEPAVAGTLSGMIIRAVEAGAASWSAGHLPREQAESLCVAFVVAGLRGALPGE